MKNIITCIYDLKAKNVLGVTLAPNEDVAIRDYKIALENKESYMSLNPHDFNLVCLGTIDLSCGDIVPDRHTIASAIDVFGSDESEI